MTDNNEVINPTGVINPAKDEYNKRKKIMKLKEYKKSVQAGQFEITAHYDSNIFKNLNANLQKNAQARNLPKINMDPNKSVFEEAREKVKDIAKAYQQNKHKNYQLELEYREINRNKEDIIKVAMANRDSANPLKTLERDERKSLIENCMKRPSEVVDINLDDFQEFAKDQMIKKKSYAKTKGKEKLDVLLG